MNDKPNESSNYRWVIVGLALLALTVSNGLAIGGMPIFSKVIREEFVEIGSVSRESAETFIGNCSNITFLMSGVFSMIGGWLIARFGLRLLMISGCLLLGSGLILQSWAASAEASYAARFLLGMSLGFVGVAPNVVLVSSWFRERRGTAIGLILTGTSFGGVLIPQLATPLIAGYGWRTAMATVSLLVWLLLLPGVVLFARENRAVVSDSEGSSEKGLTLTEALKTPQFWLLGLCAAAVFYPIFATTQQFLLYLQSPKIGLSLQMAGVAQSLLFAVSIGGKFLAGFLSDKFSPSRVMAAFGALMFAATFILFYLTADTSLYFVSLFGLGYGGIFVLIQRTVSDFFGRRDYGKILGTITLIEIVGAAIGGRTVAFLADKSGGDYTVAFYSVAAAAGIAFLGAATLMLHSKNRRL